MGKQPVKVVVRLRPSAAFARKEITVDGGTGHVHITLPRSTNDVLNNCPTEYDFRLDNVLDRVAQEEVFEHQAKPLMESVLSGYNATLMAYGQTGAGKTYTMFGGSTYEERGIIPRALHYFFSCVNDRPEYAYTFSVSFLEIYNETLFDLLSLNNSSSDLQIAENTYGQTIVKGLTTRVVNNEEEALSFMFEGETNRAIAEHQLNASSSRSHSIFTIHAEVRSRVDSSQPVLRSKFNLVDLAGSERVAKTGSDGVILREARYINQSLTFLEQVVLALSSPHRDHIPYRQCRLTNVLRDSLGGNCKTLLIANVWPEKRFLEESLATLRFATRMMRVQTEPHKNIVQTPEQKIKELERCVQELRQELAMHDQLSGRSLVQYDDYSAAQRQELRSKLLRYLTREVDDMELSSVRQMKELLRVFRDIYHEASFTSSAPAKKAASGKDGIDTTISAVSNGPLADEDEDGVGELATDISGLGVGVAAPAASNRIQSYIQNTHRSHGSAPTTGGREESAAAAVQPDAAPRDQAPDREVAWKHFKETHESGKQLSEGLKMQMTQCREAKQACREIASTVNDCKHRIDQIKSDLDNLKRERMQTGDYSSSTHDGVEIIDEDEFKLLTEMRDTKRNYRDAFQQLQDRRREAEYRQQLVEQGRVQLVQQFEKWYLEEYGVSPLGESSVENLMNTHASQKRSSHAEALSNAVVLDESEKFEQLAVDRLANQDPESVPYFQAKRAVRALSTSQRPARTDTRRRVR